MVSVARRHCDAHISYFCRVRNGNVYIDLVVTDCSRIYRYSDLWGVLKRKGVTIVHVNHVAFDFSGREFFKGVGTGNACRGRRYGLKVAIKNTFQWSGGDSAGTSPCPRNRRDLRVFSGSILFHEPPLTFFQPTLCIKVTASSVAL